MDRLVLTHRHSSASPVSIFSRKVAVVSPKVEELKVEASVQQAEMNQEVHMKEGVVKSRGHWKGVRWASDV